MVIKYEPDYFPISRYAYDVNNVFSVAQRFTIFTIAQYRVRLEVVTMAW